MDASISSVLSVTAGDIPALDWANQFVDAIVVQAENRWALAVLAGNPAQRRESSTLPGEG